ncbi:MAG: FtsX-like permease family protein [Planctomycetota bacterium]
MDKSTLRIAWRNLGRSRKRTALALLAIAVGQFALLATQGLMRGYVDNIQRAITGPMIGHVQIHAPEWREERALELVIPKAEEKLLAIRALPAVASASARIYAPMLLAPREAAFTAMLLGVDVKEESRPYGLLSGLKRPLEPGHVLLGRRLARQIEARPGQTIALVGQAADGSIANDLFAVEGVVSSPADLVNQSGILLSLPDAQKLLVMPGEAHEIVVRGRNVEELGRVLAELKSLPPLRSLEILPWRELVPELVLIIDTSHYVGYFVLVLVFLAAVTGIANTLMMATFERMHEFGMLLALGCRPARLVRMIMTESVLLGILGVVAGTALGGLFVFVTARTGIDMASWGGPDVKDLAYGGLNLPLQVSPRLEPTDPFLGLAAVLFTSLVAALWPASIAARLEPMEAMRA